MATLDKISDLLYKGDFQATLKATNTFLEETKERQLTLAEMAKLENLSVTVALRTDAYITDMAHFEEEIKRQTGRKIHARNQAAKLTQIQKKLRKKQNKPETELQKLSRSYIERTGWKLEED